MLRLGLIGCLLGLCITQSCQQVSYSEQTRPLADTVGFATKAWQMDSLLARSWHDKSQPKKLIFSTPVPHNIPAKVIISPHDDYAYVGSLYPQLLQTVKASNLIIFGVAHRARAFKIENQLVFDSFARWHGLYQPIKPHPLREFLQRDLPSDLWVRNDSLQAVEHSIEALLPFLQYLNRQIRIVPILVPAMPYERMTAVGARLAQAISHYARRHDWQWGKDFAIVISCDAVHYGDADWGGKNYAPYGCGGVGYQKALEHEKQIIDSCLTGLITPRKVELFTHFTLQPNDFREYRWTWCGRYSVPVGLLTAYYLQQEWGEPINGYLIGYSTSIEPPLIHVHDWQMGVTAPANERHWVGYAAIGYF